MLKSSIELLQEAHTSFEKIWKEIGLDKEEKKNRHFNFNNRLKLFLENEKLTEERYLHELKSETAKLRALCADLQSRLGETVQEGGSLFCETQYGEELSLFATLQALFVARNGLEKKEENLKRLIKVHLDALNELEKTLNSEETPMPQKASKDFLQNVLKRKAVLENKNKKRIMKFKIYLSEYSDLISKLGINCGEKEDEFKIEIDTNTKHIDHNAFTNLKHRRAELLQMLEARKVQFEHLRSKVASLCKKLGVEASVDLNTVDGHFASTEYLDKLKHEEERLTVLDNKSAEKRIQDLKCRILKLKKDLEIVPVEETDSNCIEAEQERKGIESRESPLVARLEELEKLKTVKGKLLRLLEKRRALLSERAVLNDCDPNRFRIPGRLLREEQVRNRLKALPKMHSRMLELAAEFQRGAGHPLWVVTNTEGEDGKQLKSVEKVSVLDEVQTLLELEKQTENEWREKSARRKFQRVDQAGFSTPKKRDERVDREDVRKTRSLVSDKTVSSKKHLADKLGRRLWNTPSGIKGRPNAKGKNGISQVDSPRTTSNAKKIKRIEENQNEKENEVDNFCVNVPMQK